MAESATGDRRLSHLVARDVVLGGGLSAAVLFVVVGLLVPDLPGQELSAWEQSVEEVLLSALLIPLAYWYVRRRAAGVLRWSDPPTREERVAVTTLPWRLAIVSLRFWIGLAAVVLVYDLVNDRYERPVLDELYNVASVVLVGLTSAGITYLASQRRLRPVYALALAGAAPTETVRIGLRRRLMLSWGLGSGVPALMILVLLAWRNDADLDAAVAVLAGAALCAGAAFAVASARNLAEPLDHLRAAVRDVTAGDLDARVTVDDATELGYLQAGFNEMTEGLRERKRIEDLFGRHVGTEVARVAMARGAALGGEHRSLSALFVDLEGSTELASTSDPAEVVAVLNDFFGHVIAVVTEEGGWVNKFHGDGALCIFGAPDDQPDHAARAVRAARRLQERLHRLPLGFGIGVSSGTAVAGNVGAEARFEYTVIGDAVNEAARLSALAKTLPGSTAASGVAVDAAGEEARHWASSGATTLRGRDAPTVLWVLAAAAAAAAQAPR